MARSLQFEAMPFLCLNRPAVATMHRNFLPFSPVSPLSPRKLVGLLLSGLPLFVTLPVHAGESGSEAVLDQPFELDEIVITDRYLKKDTLSSVHLTEETLAPLRARVVDTARLLEDVPGVHLYGGGAVSGLPVIRGLNDDRVRMDVNGMTVTSACANHMNPPLSYIDRSNVGKITVLSGLTPVSKGGDSIGGTIIVESPEPVFAAPGQDILLSGSASAFYRSNGDGFGGSIAAGVANGHARLDYTGSHTESRNYFDGNGDEVKSWAYENQNHAAALSFQFDNHLLVIRGGQQHIPFQNYPNARMDLTNNDSIFGNVLHRASFHWGKLESRFYFESTEHSMDIGEDKQRLALPPPNNVMPMETRGRNLGYKIQAEIPVTERDTVRVGNEFHSNRIRDFWPPVHTNTTGPVPPGLFWMMAPMSFINLNDGERDRVGTFAEWEADWSDEWKTLLGVRHDHTATDTGDVRPYNPNLLGGAGAAGAGIALRAANEFNARDHERANDTFDVTALTRYTPNTMSQYEFGYARKNRAPNLYERYTWGRRHMDMAMIGWFGDGNGYVGNLDLKPETAHHISFTADFHDARGAAWEIQATPYFTYVENFIDVDRCPVSLGGACSAANLTARDSFVYLQYANHDARLYGVDLSGRARLYSDADLGEFSANTVMSYVRGERMDGGNLYHMMPFNAKLGLNHALAGWRSTLEMQFVDAKDDVQAIRNETKTPSYLLLNARTGYDWGKVRVDLGLDNLLDKQYFHPLAGAYLGDRFGMNPTGPAATTVPWGRNVPGMGRAFYVGLTVRY
jgi:iron complex outermembrane receptor protein